MAVISTNVPRWLVKDIAAKLGITSQLLAKRLKDEDAPKPLVKRGDVLKQRKRPTLGEYRPGQSIVVATHNYYDVNEVVNWYKEAFPNG